MVHLTITRRGATLDAAVELHVLRPHILW
jgi:hypothetical protein